MFVWVVRLIRFKDECSVAGRKQSREGSQR